MNLKKGGIFQGRRNINITIIQHRKASLSIMTRSSKTTRISLDLQTSSSPLFLCFIRCHNENEYFIGWKSHLHNHIGVLLIKEIKQEEMKMRGGLCSSRDAMQNAQRKEGCAESEGRYMRLCGICILEWNEENQKSALFFLELLLFFLSKEGKEYYERWISMHDHLLFS